MERGNSIDIESSKAQKGFITSDLCTAAHPPGDVFPDQGIPPGGPLPAQYLAGLAGYANELNITELNNPCIQYYGPLRFYSLQHMNQELNVLSSKTLSAANPTWQDLERLRFLLHEHTIALKDLEYINEHLLGASEDAYNNNSQILQKHHLSPGIRSNGWIYSPPHASSFDSQLQIFLQAHLPRWLSWSLSERKSKPVYYAKGKLPKKISTAVRITASMILSLSSGASIIVPMIVMSFDESKTKSLVTVSVAVVLFGFVLGAVARARTENVYLATATYAAVLVVFVGISGSGGE